MALLKDFKEFAMKGNVIDMAVGIVIGAAFGKIVTSLVSDIIMPPIGMLLGHVNFSDLVLQINDPISINTKPILIKYGLFLNTIFDFLIVAFAIFMVVSQLKRLRKKATAPEPTTKTCPYCQSTISIKATRCPNCTSQL